MGRLGHDRITRWLSQPRPDVDELICTHWDHRQQRYVKGHGPSLLCQAGAVALSIAVELVRNTVPANQPKTQNASYQSPFIRNEYLQQRPRVALPGRPQP